MPNGMRMASCWPQHLLCERSVCAIDMRWSGAPPAINVLRPLLQAAPSRFLPVPTNLPMMLMPNFTLACLPASSAAGTAALISALIAAFRPEIELDATRAPALTARVPGFWPY